MGAEDPRIGDLGAAPLTAAPLTAAPLTAAGSIGLLKELRTQDPTKVETLAGIALTLVLLSLLFVASMAA